MSQLSVACIRDKSNSHTLCGERVGAGSSISLRHRIEQPEHCKSLHLCSSCEQEFNRIASFLQTYPNAIY